MLDELCNPEENTELKCSDYRQMLMDPLLLKKYREIHALSSVLQQIKADFKLHKLTDSALIRQLSHFNQKVQGTGLAATGLHWLPAYYNTKNKTLHWQQVRGKPIQPFFDQYLMECQSQIALNAVVQPKTLLKDLDPVLKNSPELAGFIFHLSRCGSTLLSGALTELEFSLIFSEAPVLTEVLLDDELSCEQRSRYLSALIQVKSRAFLTDSPVVIKWNAWDLCHFDLIQKLYPQVPVLFLIRSPLEILASHQHQPGRHMASDPVICRLLNAVSSESLLSYQIEVLKDLMQKMLAIVSDCGQVRLMDYQDLKLQGVCKAAEYFGYCNALNVIDKITARLMRHSKLPEQEFSSDSAEKQNFFTSTQRQQILLALQPLYQQLLNYRVKDY